MEANDAVAEAASWFLRLRDGPLNDAERLDWERWIDDARHAALYREVEDIWVDLDAISEAAPIDEWCAPAPGRQPPRTALLRSVAERLSHMLKRVQVTLTPLRLAVTCGAAGLAVLLVFGSADTGAPQRQSDAVLQTFQTGKAEHRRVTLADSSAVELGADSVLVVRYAEDVRLITLVEGEALFEVQPDRSRPFVVDVGFGRVRAVGTAFNINRARAQARVTVLEGLVDVSGDSDSADDSSATIMTVPGETLLSASEEVTISGGGIVTRVEQPDLERAVSWRTYVLTFDNESLETVINDINRYSRKKIVINSPRLASRRISGTYFVGRTDEWLEGLRQTYDLTLIELGNDTVAIM